MSQTVESPRVESLVSPPQILPVTGSRWRHVPTVVGTACIIAVGAAFIAYAVRAGMPATAAVRAVVAVAVSQVLPGALVWRAVRPRHGWWIEDLAMGFAIGSVLAVGAQVIAGLTRLQWLSAGIGIATAVVLLALPVTRARISDARTAPLGWWWGAIVAVTPLVAFQQLQEYFRLVPLDWPSGARVPHVDAHIHLSLAAQLANRGPTRFPWVESEPLAYHWFSHAWVAQVSEASGAGLDELLFRFMPALMPTVVAVSVAIAAVRLSGRQWAGPVAAVLTMAAGDLNVFGKPTAGYVIAPLSPSLGLAIPMLITIVVILGVRWRFELGRGGVLLLAVMAVGAAGTKGSTVPLVIAGLALALVLMLVLDRSRVRPLLLDLAVVIGSLLFAWVAVFRGSDAGLQPDFAGAASWTPGARWLGGVTSGAAQAFVIVVAVTAVFARALGTVALVADRRSRREPLTWLLLGASLAGALAVGVFTHPGASQWYFARTAGPLMALGSTLGLVLIVDRLGPQARTALPLGVMAGPALAFVPYAVLGPLLPGGLSHAVAMIGVAAAVLAVVGGLAFISGSGRLQVVGSVLLVAVLAADISVGVNVLTQYSSPRPAAAAVDAPGAVSRDQIEAARWIRANSDVDDLVMTNRHCVSPTPPVDCDSRRYVVAAYSERQVLVEGWTPAPKAQEIAPEGRDSITVDYWKPELLALNDRFIAQPTQADAAQLQQLGVRWVFVDHTRPYAESLEPYAELRYRNPGVDVYEFVSAD